jgi:hypothetical protein
MNVFILEEYVEYDGAYFVGVYSSKEKAQEKIEGILTKRFEGHWEVTAYYYKEDARDNFQITEYVVDGKPIGEVE